MDRNEAQAVREVIEEAVAHRGRYYSGSFAFSIRFEADNTSAFRDIAHFQDMLRLLGHSEAKEFVLKKDDRIPGWTAGCIIPELDALVSKIEGRTLVIGHYAGHGAIENGQLVFFASPSAPRSFGLEKSLSQLYQDNTGTDPAFEKTDVVLILDSCYSGQAVRGLGPATRSVEIIASVAADQQALENAPNLSRVQHRTFTSRLADSVARKIGRGDSSSVSFAEIVGELRSQSHSQRLPEYHLQVGRVGIRVPILGKTSLPPHLRALLGHRHTPSSSSASDQSAGIPATPTPQLNAVFTSS
ncbi:MAG: hypothetical protein M1839_004673 [Geoglossum umbratile]|nr:MAG: hypothetical protein M1839_004673 [Geoglossum umbratile]